MEKEIFFFTAEEISNLLGVNLSSIHRWTESGKLKCFCSEEGDKKFSTEHLAEFAMTYNISMKFLDTMKLKSSVRQNVTFVKSSAA